MLPHCLPDTFNSALFDQPARPTPHSTKTSDALQHLRHQLPATLRPVLGTVHRGKFPPRFGRFGNANQLLFPHRVDAAAGIVNFNADRLALGGAYSWDYCQRRLHLFLRLLPLGHIR